MPMRIIALAIKTVMIGQQRRGMTKSSQ